MVRILVGVTIRKLYLHQVIKERNILDNVKQSSFDNTEIVIFGRLEMYFIWEMSSTIFSPKSYLEKIWKEIDSKTI